MSPKCQELKDKVTADSKAAGKPRPLHRGGTPWRR